LPKPLHLDYMLTCIKQQLEELPPADIKYPGSIAD
jgi:hypothetical protein